MSANIPTRPNSAVARPAETSGTVRGFEIIGVYSVTGESQNPRTVENSAEWSGQNWLKSFFKFYEPSSREIKFERQSRMSCQNIYQKFMVCNAIVLV